MFDAFKIAVTISLVDHASAGLMKLATHFASSNAQATQLQNRIGKIQGMLTAGTAMTGMGMGMLGKLKGSVEDALEWQRQLSKMQQMGLSQSQRDEAEQFVKTTDIIGASMQKRLQLFTEAQGAFRESGMDGSHALEASKVMMPILSRYEVASDLLGGKSHAALGQAMGNLNKTVDILGGLQDTDRAKAIADGVFKAVASSGNMVAEKDLKQFVAYGQSAATNQNLRTLFGGLEPIIGELGGSSTGVGLRTAFGRMNGYLSGPPKQMVREALRLGMWDKDHVVLNDKGGVDHYIGNPQNAEMAKLESEDIVTYAVKTLEKYQAHGITSVADRERENAILFGTTGAKVMNRIMAQMPTIQQSMIAYDKAQAPDQVIEGNKNGPGMQILRYHAALKDLSTIIGNDLLPHLTPVIEKLANWGRELAKHPGLLKTLTMGFVSLGIALVGCGVITTLVGGFSAMALVLGVITWPIALAVAGIGLLGGIIYNFVTDWDGSVQKLQAAWNTVTDIFGKLVKAIASGIKSLWDARPGWMGGHGGSPVNGSAVKPGSTAPVVAVEHVSYVDGAKLAQSVTYHQSRSAGRPAAGPTNFNPGMSLPKPVGAFA